MLFLLYIINFLPFISSAVYEQIPIFKKDSKGYHCILTITPALSFNKAFIFKNNDVKDANNAKAIEQLIPEYIKEGEYKLQIGKRLAKSDIGLLSFRLNYIDRDGKAKYIFTEPFTYSEEDDEFIHADQVKTPFYKNKIFILSFLGFIVPVIGVFSYRYFKKNLNKPVNEELDE